MISKNFVIVSDFTLVFDLNSLSDFTLSQRIWLNESGFNLNVQKLSKIGRIWSKSSKSDPKMTKSIHNNDLLWPFQLNLSFLIDFNHFRTFYWHFLSLFLTMFDLLIQNLNQKLIENKQNSCRGRLAQSEERSLCDPAIQVRLAKEGFRICGN